MTDPDIRRVIDDTLAKALVQHTAARQERELAALERHLAADWHRKAQRAFWACIAAAGANVLVLVVQLTIGYGR